MNRPANPELTILRKSAPVVQASEEHAIAPIRIGIGSISRHHPSFVQLYYAIEARRTSAMPLAVQFISPTPGTGASTVASGYARVAADDCAQPVLYIDCNGTYPKPRRGAAEMQPPTLLDVLRRGLPLTDVADVAAAARDSKTFAIDFTLPESGRAPNLLPGDREDMNLSAVRRLTCLTAARGRSAIGRNRTGRRSAR